MRLCTIATKRRLSICNFVFLKCFSLKEVYTIVLYFFFMFADDRTVLNEAARKLCEELAASTKSPPKKDKGRRQLLRWRCPDFPTPAQDCLLTTAVIVRRPMKQKQK